MASDNTLSPEITDDYSDLATLGARTMRRAGEFAPGSIDGDMSIMLIDFANEIVEELRIHPYWPKDVRLRYYQSLTDRRPIPDLIVTNGLLAKYFLQQGDKRTDAAMSTYARMANTILYDRMFGVQDLELQAVDRPRPHDPSIERRKPWPSP